LPLQGIKPRPCSSWSIHYTDWATSASVLRTEVVIKRVGIPTSGHELYISLYEIYVLVIYGIQFDLNVCGTKLCDVFMFGNAATYYTDGAWKCNTFFIESTERNEGQTLLCGKKLYKTFACVLFLLADNFH
jgi:hypothetical protein